MRSKPFAIFTWAVLLFTLMIIVWGAFVRATGSGAGCGNHWPSCHGEIVPRTATMETVIEYTHRLTGGLGGLFMIGLVVWAFFIYERKHPVVIAAVISLIFFMIEGGIGAGLVKFELVADNASLARAIAISLHLVNTFILLTFMTLTSWWASGGQAIAWQKWQQEGWLIGLGLLAVILIGATGAVTALGDTLFPDESLAEGLRQDLSPTVHWLKRLRVVHPLIALLTGLLMVQIGIKYRQQTYSVEARRFANGLIVMFVLQLIGGFINVFLLAPVWMQLVHLFMADVVWILLVLLGASVLAETPEQQQKNRHPHRLAVH
ncbi:MAG: COX15/CtaA family protein [Chloroflexota bacterium]